MSDETGPKDSVGKLDRAIGLHNEGAIAEAVGVYEEVLSEDSENSNALHLLGVCKHQLGDSESGIRLIRKAIAVSPGEAAYYSNLGVCLKAVERFEESVSVLEKGIALDPEFMPAIYNAGESYSLMGDFENGVRCYRRVLELQPQLPQVWNNLGICLAKLNQFDEAEESYHKALELQSDYGLALYSLGALKEETNRSSEARPLFAQALRFGFDESACLRRLVSICLNEKSEEEALNYIQRLQELGDDSANLHNNLGLVYQQLNENEAARSEFEKALSLDADNVSALINYASFSISVGEVEEAMRLATRCVGLVPEDALARNVMGNAYRASGNLEFAEAEYRKAIAIDPTRAQFYNNLGVVLAAVFRGEEAEASYAKALEIDPKYVEVRVNQAAIAIKVGELGRAQSILKEGLEIDPGHRGCLVNYGRTLIDSGEFSKAEEVFSKILEGGIDDYVATTSLAALQVYRDDVSDEDIMQAHRSVASRIVEIAGAPSLTKVPEGGRSTDALKVGFVSSDLRNHSVSYFLKPLLSGLKGGTLETFCYANVEKPDGMTDELRKLAGSWRDVFAKSDLQLAELIREDGIDLLIDLNGYTSGNRLNTFLFKPAPVQASWLGYAHSTGLDCIDYRIVDKVSDPEGTTLNSEELCYIPDSFLCYSPPERASDVSPSPVLKKGQLTFGSFNNSTKISSQCIELWAGALKAVEDSKLILKSGQFLDEGIRQKLLEAFSGYGIDSGRIELRGRTMDTESHLDMYHEVDIALDSYPYNGTTTTCEALWMGVPVISLCGTRHAARVGASLLTAVGLKELVTDSPEAFAKCAGNLSKDLGGLNSMRLGMRKRLIESPLMDEEGFAKKMSEAFHSMVVPQTV